MEEEGDGGSATGKIGDATLVPAMDARGERRAHGTERGPSGRGRDDGERVGVGADLLPMKPAKLREEVGVGHQALLHETRERRSVVFHVVSDSPSLRKNPYPASICTCAGK